MGEVWWGRIGFWEVGNADFDGDNGHHTTASDCFEVKTGVGQLKSSHVKSVLMRHVQIRHIPDYSEGCHRRCKWGNEMRASSHQLRHNKHLCGTETAKMAWSAGQTSICYNSKPQWPGNDSPKWKSRNCVHGSVLGALITSWRVGGASCAHPG